MSANSTLSSDQIDESLLVDARKLGQLLNLSLRTIRRLDTSGRLPRPIRLGGVVRWRVSEIRDWVAQNCPDRQAWEASNSHRQR